MSNTELKNWFETKLFKRALLFIDTLEWCLKQVSAKIQKVFKLIFIEVRLVTIIFFVIQFTLSASFLSPIDEKLKICKEKLTKI